MRITTAVFLACSLFVLIPQSAEAQQLLGQATVQSGIGTTGLVTHLSIGFTSACQQFHVPGPWFIDEQCDAGLFAGYAFTPADSGRTFYVERGTDANFDRLVSILTNGSADTLVVVAATSDGFGISTSSVSETPNLSSPFGSFNKTGPNGIDFGGLTISRIGLRIDSLTITSQSATGTTAADYALTVLVEGNASDCHPPIFISVDNQKAVPLSAAVLSNEVTADCQRTVDVRIVNNLTALWLGVERIRVRSDVVNAPKPTVVALSSSQQLLGWGRFGVIPPCRFSGVFDPTCDPGNSWWRAGFTDPGNAEFTLTLTGRSLTLTLLDLLFNSFLELSPTEFMGIADELDQVPTINNAAKCLKDKNNFKGVTCAVNEMLGLTTRFRQQRDIIRILGSHGFNMGVDELLGLVTKFASVGAFELSTSLGVWFATAIFSDNPGVLTVKLDAR
jgi:hypothetical protein